MAHPEIGMTVYEWNESRSGKGATFAFPGTEEPVVFAKVVTKVTPTSFTTDDGSRYIINKYNQNSNYWRKYGQSESYHPECVRGSLPDGARVVTRAEFEAALVVASQAKKSAADEARRTALAEDGIWRTVAKTVRNHGGSFGCQSELRAIQGVVEPEKMQEFIDALMSELSDARRSLKDAADAFDSLASRAADEAKRYRQTLG